MVLAGYKPVFGNLGRVPDFVAALSTHLENLRQHGVLYAVQAAT
jgi:fructuronate reductase